MVPKSTLFGMSCIVPTAGFSVACRQAFRNSGTVDVWEELGRASFHQMKCETMQIVKHRRLFDPGVFTPFNLKRDEYEASTAEQAHARTGE
ncbi:MULTISPECIES: hypothetical protein [unclassified Brucella]|uniref:hypothetical protein n=1 Tax=unclassified Brucella TaxID=2632610 RepID=UPI00217E2DD5|nr:MULTISPECIES: hypothetical protein [unclassified Brucella]UWF66306.1 hypothetical protein NYO63_08865 [Brucella sp. 1315]UWF69429.1 hypothetical protein NYO65_08860 [Brucella sp. 2594]